MTRCLSFSLIKIPMLVLLSVSSIFCSVTQARPYHYGAINNAQLLTCDKHYWHGELVQATSCYQQLLSSDVAAEIKAEAAWALNDKQQANRLFSAASRVQPSNSVILTRWADLYADSFQLDEALKMYTQASEFDPDNQFAALGAAFVLLASRDQEAASAVQSFTTALNVNAGLRFKALLTMAFRALESNKLEDAERLLNTIELQIDEDEISRLEYLALRASVDVRRRTDPTQWIEQALAINPHYGDIYAIPAYFYMITFNYDKTGEFYQKAVDVQPDHWQAHLQLGSNHLRQNRASAARTHFEISYEGDPFNPEAVNLMRLMNTYEKFDVVNFPERPDNAILPIVTLKMDGKESDLLAPYASKLAQQAIDTFTERYQFKLRETATIEIYPSHDDFIVRSIGMPGAGLLGVAFGYLVAMDSPTAKAGTDYHWGTTLWHEVAHIFTLGASEHLVPRWFSEGVSVFEEWQTGPIPGTRIPLHVLQSLTEHDFLPVATLDSGFVQTEYENQVIVSYMQAGLICEFITSTYGFEKLVEILDSYKHGLLTGEVIEQVFKMTPEKFDAEFANYFESNYGALLKNLPKWSDYQQQAKENLRDDNWQQAIKYADLSLSLNPNYTEADSGYLMKARAYRELDNKAAQMQSIEQYWHAGGYQFDPLFTLADYFQSINRKDDAIKILQGLNLLSPFNLELHFQLGDLLIATGNIDEALTEYKVAMALDPLDKAAAHFRLANAYYQLKNGSDAESHLMSALDIAPHYKPAQQLLLQMMSPNDES
jgi:tetratricopeptide (TPR) repeat protein